MHAENINFEKRTTLKEKDKTLRKPKKKKADWTQANKPENVTWW